MRSGFFYPFDTPDSLPAYERQHDGLPKDVKNLDDVQADEHGCTIHLNSTYLDMIDRWHMLRGGPDTTVMIIMLPVAMAILAFTVYLCIQHLVTGVIQQGDITVTIFGMSLSSVLLWVVFALLKPFSIVKKEYSSYTHFPIRFNRKTRMVHVFRHNGPGGVLSIPWDEAWFHIGHGTHDKEILDLRCLVMKGNTVTDTFAVGNIADNTEYIKQVWKFLVIYMEQGPRALPSDNYINTSTDSGWYNQFTDAYLICHMYFPIPPLSWVFIPLITAARWLIMKTCKTPVWPQEIVAESAIDTNDPYVWEELNVNARDSFKRDPARYEKMQARLKRLGKRK